MLTVTAYWDDQPTAKPHVSSTELQVAVPSAATTGRITIKNTTTPSGSVRSAANFTVT
jgi:hypothetical protein